MSIFVEGTRGCRTDRSGFIGGLSCFPITESSSSMAGIGTGGDHQRFPAERVSGGNNVIQKRRQLERSSLSSCSSSSSSSIGRNSDLEGESSDCEEESEIQSSFDSMTALEQVLPIRRGISKFYSGKSKSFTSLSEASSSYSSMKEIGKPENAYSRKRKNLIASSNYILEGSSKKNNNTGEAEISKRVKHQYYNQRDLTNIDGSVGKSLIESNRTSEEHLDTSFLFPPLRLIEKTTVLLSKKINISGRRSFSLMNLQYPSVSANNVE